MARWSCSRFPALLCTTLVAFVFGPCAEAASAQSVGWLRDPRCGTSCDPVSHLCLAASTYKTWDACPAGAVEVARGEALDASSCERSSQCRTDRACPLYGMSSANVYVSCDPSGCSGALEDCSKGGPAVITCCAMRTQVTCAAAFACTFGAAGARRLAQDWSSDSPPPTDLEDAPPPPSNPDPPSFEPPPLDSPSAPLPPDASPPMAPEDSELPSGPPPPSQPWAPGFDQLTMPPFLPAMPPSNEPTAPPTSPEHPPDMPPDAPFEFKFKDVIDLARRTFVDSAKDFDVGFDIPGVFHDVHHTVEEVLGSVGEVLGPYSGVLRIAAKAFSKAGNVLANIPIIMRWYAERWDGAIQPWVDYALCSSDNRAAISEEVLIVAEDVVRDIILPPVKIFFLATKSGAVISDVLLADYGLNTRAIDGAATRENGLKVVHWAMRLLKAMTRDGNNVVRKILDRVTTEILGDSGRLTPAEFAKDVRGLAANLISLTFKSAVKLGPDAGDLVKALFSMEAKEAKAFVKVIEWLVSKDDQTDLILSLIQIPPKDTWDVRNAQPFRTLFPPTAPTCQAGWNQPVSSHPVFVSALETLAPLGDVLGLLNKVAECVEEVVNTVRKSYKAFWSFGRMVAGAVGSVGKLLGLADNVFVDSGLLSGVEDLLDVALTEAFKTTEASEDQLTDVSEQPIIRDIFRFGAIALDSVTKASDTVSNSLGDGSPLEKLVAKQLDGLTENLGLDDKESNQDQAGQAPPTGVNRRLLMGSRSGAVRSVAKDASITAEPLVAPQEEATSGAARRLAALTPESVQVFSNFVSSVERLRPAVANLVTALRASSQERR